VFADRSYLIVLFTRFTFVVAMEGDKPLSAFVARRSDFEHIRDLGSGSFGLASLARDTRTGEIVVVKVVHRKPLDERHRRMFEREVEILASVDHATLLGFRGFVPVDPNTDELPAIVTEFAAGGSLQDVIDAERAKRAVGRWDGTQKMITLFGIAYGMMILHRRKIVHRDLKPENVFLNGELEPKIADFGTSKFVEARGGVLQTSDIGTPLYWAPEIWRREDDDDYDYDFSADVYAYAVLVYATISGLSPFEELNPRTRSQVKKKVLAGERPALPVWLGDSPWRGLIESCWAQQPGDRFTFEGVVRAMGGPEFFGRDVEVDRLLDYQKRVAAAEFFSRPGSQPKRSGLSKIPFESLMTAADSGDAVSQVICGHRLSVGDGVRQDFAKAANYFKLAADQGDADSQFNYGVCLENGCGVTQDFEKAATYFRMAADQGHADGQFNYGVCLDNGHGVTQNFEKAATYYRMAADQGNACGQFNYGVCLYNGRGVAQDFEKAATYFRMAADQGDADGQFNYGVCLDNGHGVAQDFEKAATYYRMAADQGDADGQFNYGVCLDNGCGVTQDFEKAATYYRMAADQGDADGQFNYGEIGIAHV
jgi:TPR repeat protein